MEDMENRRTKEWVDYTVTDWQHNIESVDSISRDGQDTPIYIIHNKTPKSSVQLQFQDV